MSASEDISWVKSTANELNNLLQVISESSQVLESISNDSPDCEKYFAILRNGVDRATRVTRMMVERAGGYSSESISAPPTPAIPEPAPSRPVAKPDIPVLASDVKIYNPTGSRELVLIVD